MSLIARLAAALLLSGSLWGQVGGSPGVTGGSSTGGGSITGGSCTNQVFTSINSSGVPTCSTVATTMIGTLAAGSNGLATSATTDATNATNITTGTLAITRLGTLAAGSNGLANSATTDTTSATNITTGTLPHAQLPALVAGDSPCTAGNVWNAGTCTPNVVLGASGTASQITFGNATSGTLIIKPATGALGAITATFPINTGTVAETNLGQTYSGFNQFTGNRQFVTADFTSANSAALQAITGLSWTLGSNQTATFHCMLMYSQATFVAGDQFGVADITTAPANLSAFGTAYTNTGAAAPISTGVLTGLASVTPTAVVTFTPAVASVLGATLDGTVEAGAGANTFNIYVLNGTAADVIVVKRGSYCDLM